MVGGGPGTGPLNPPQNITEIFGISAQSASTVREGQQRNPSPFFMTPFSLLMHLSTVVVPVFTQLPSEFENTHLRLAPWDVVLQIPLLRGSVWVAGAVGGGGTGSGGGHELPSTRESELQPPPPPPSAIPWKQPRL